MTRLLITCEHAGHALPAGVTLELDATVLQSQASWDHGALDIARGLADAFRGEVLAGTYSRLYVDLNRPIEHPDVIPEWCYGAHVPSNARLAVHERRARLEAVHTPHWRKIRASIEDAIRQRQQVVHVASHSFCTLLDPSKRQFDLGLLYDPSREREAAVVSAIEAACAANGLTTRRNEPYTGIGPGVTSSMRAAFDAADYVGVTVETSHAVTMRPGGCAHVALVLANALAHVGIAAA